MSNWTTLLAMICMLALAIVAINAYPAAFDSGSERHLVKREAPAESTATADDKYKFGFGGPFGSPFGSPFGGGFGGGAYGGHYGGGFGGGYGGGFGGGYGGGYGGGFPGFYGRR